MTLSALEARLSELHHLGNIAALLDWDQQVNMPPGGAQARAEQFATLSKIMHEALVADETARLLEAAEKETADLDYNSDEASLVRLARRSYDQAAKLPTELVTEIDRTTALAYQVWTEAREQKDFAKFQPMLEKVYDLVGQKAEHLGYEDDIYDALLDQFEPGMTSAEVTRLFTELREGLVPLVAAIADNQDAVSDDIVHLNYPIDKQRKFNEMVVADFGFDFSRGRQDVAVHPFCTSFSCNDVRITNRYEIDWLSSALFTALHESGHGMYEQGIAQNLDENILGTGTSLGIHESQSRMWENVVGRSRGFWGHYFPKLKAIFPEQLADTDVDTFYGAVNASEPSLIRVEADEVTYNLHIMVRFDLEMAVLHGDVAVKDLPDAWNAKYEEYLGITPPDDALGVLQDVHWSSGIMGYFPTYALGNLLSMQFYDKAVETHPDIPEQIGRGEFNTLREWMRENIYQHGSKFKPQELVERVTGTSIQTGPFLDYVRTKYTDLYGL